MHQRLEIALTVTVMGACTALALLRVNELQEDGRQAGAAYQASRERMARTVEQALCASSPASRPATSCPSSVPPGVQP